MSPSERLLRDRVVRAAMRFWQMHKPVAWTMQKFIHNPTVNATSYSAEKMHRACAALAALTKKRGAK